MSWLVDNAIALYVLFGIAAVGLLLIWRNNRQAKYLAFTAGVLALIGLVWLATQLIDSDSKQLENNVNAMALAVKDGKVDDLFKHISNDFRYKEKDRDLMYAAVQLAMAANRITDVKIKNFRVDELSRDKKFAKTWFRVYASSKEDLPPFVTQADFVLEGDQWKLKAMRFYNPMVNQDQEVDLLGLR